MSSDKYKSSALSNTYHFQNLQFFVSQLVLAKSIAVKGHPHSTHRLILQALYVMMRFLYLKNVVRAQGKLKLDPEYFFGQTIFDFGAPPL